MFVVWISEQARIISFC